MIPHLPLTWDDDNTPDVCDALIREEFARAKRCNYRLRIDSATWGRLSDPWCPCCGGTLYWVGSASGSATWDVVQCHDCGAEMEVSSTWVEDRVCEGYDDGCSAILDANRDDAGRREHEHECHAAHAHRVLEQQWRETQDSLRGVL
jgi:DNA-directed RNA polymerase subunit M/transcription elongation factor TFIIS